MKTRRHIFGGLMLAAAALVCLTGCKKDDEGEKITLGVDFEQTAGMQKTYVGNSDKTIYWSTDDSVKVNGKNYLVHDGVVEVKLSDDGYAAVYPATEGNILTYSGGTSGRYCTGGSVVIPATQNYTTDVNTGVQKLNAPMAARLDTKTGRLLFRNLYAVIKVTVKAKETEAFTLNSITVESTNGVNLAGTQAFTFNNKPTNTDAPTLGNLTNSSTGVTLTFSTPVTISANEKDSFYLYTVPFSEANLMITINGNLVDDTDPKGPRVGIAIDRSRLGSTMVDAVKLHEFVDLGLTSGILWATCNVGASKREDFGDYYAWGETETYYTGLKADYTPTGWKTGKELGYCRETYSGDGQPTGSDENDAKIIEWDPVPFAYDDKTNTYQLKSTNDAATNWSNKWRTPTHAELQELVNNCTWEWKENYNDNGHKGYLVTSKINGYTDKAIFLPAAGRYSGTELQNDDKRLYYSSSTLTGASGSRHICYLCYCPTDKDEEKGALQFGWRDQGFSVRPVMPK